MTDVVIDDGCSGSYGPWQLLIDLFGTAVISSERRRPEISKLSSGDHRFSGAGWATR